MYEDAKKSKKRGFVFLGIVVFGLAIFGISSLFSFILSDTITAETQEQRFERITAERNEFLASLTREQILDDIDYMMYILEENYPYLELLYRVRGVDMREHGRQLREKLEDETIELDLQTFWDIMQDYFFIHANATGHLFPIGRSVYINQLANSSRYLSYPWNAWIVEAITSDASKAFYGEITDDDLDISMEIEPDPNNITTEIIEEGRIGYIRVNRMLGTTQSEDLVILRPFYNEIADFEHLIIDIRGNPGGWPWYFYERITAPHINNTISLRYWYFLKGGELNMDFLERATHRFQYEPSSFEIVDGQIMTGLVGDTFLNLGRGHLLLDELKNFDYAVMHRETLAPFHSRWGLRNDFSGQIWLLVDEMSASASEHVAALYKRENLAVIVGETTRGAIWNPGLRNLLFALPNTGLVIRFEIGYVIDRTGRSLAEGIPPHIFNRPGMDALETVLALIKEGAY